MRDNFFKNGLVISIALIFIGAATLPTVLSKSIEKESIPAMRGIIWVDDDDKDVPVPPADYDTIQKAIDNANPGDEIRVCKGTYVENIVVDKSLTLTGGINGTSTIDGGGSGSVVTVTALAEVIVDNFHINNSGDFYDDTSSPWPRDAGISISVRIGHTITNNNISDNNGVGIYMYNGAGNAIENNIISNNAHDGIGAYQCTGTKVENNTVEGNGWDGIYFLRGLQPRVFFNKVSGNGWDKKDCAGIKLHRTRGVSPVVANIGYNEITDNDGCGMILKVLSIANNIQENDIYGNSEFGIYLQRWCFFNSFVKNNLEGNNQGGEHKLQAFFDGCLVNNWYQNYWSDAEDRTIYQILGIYPIWGTVLGFIPWIGLNFDTDPQTTPN